MRHLWLTVCMAEEMAELLGTSQILLRALPALTY